jgi:HEAT repeat protein
METNLIEHTGGTMKRKSTIHAAIVAILMLGLAGCETKPEEIEKWKAQGNTGKLIEAINDPRQSIRIGAIEALAELKPQEAVEPLGRLFTDPDLVILHKAIEAVAQFGGSSIEPYMLEALNFPTVEARTTAATALGIDSSAAAVEPLIAALTDEYEAVAVAAAISLGQIADPRAIEPLAAKIEVHSYTISMVCVVSLSQIGGKAGAAGLAPAMGNMSEKIRMTVVEGLVGIGTESVPYALEGLRSADKLTRPSAVAVLKGIGAVPAAGSDLVWFTLAGIPANPKVKVDFSIVESLAAIKDGTAGLLEAVAHSDNEIREYAFHALDAIGEPAAGAAVAAAEQNSSPAGQVWFEDRSAWKGAPSWRLDLWGAAVALSPKFSLNLTKTTALEGLDADARTLMGSPRFQPAAEYIPLLIAQCTTPSEMGNKSRKKNVVQNKVLAQKKLSLIGSKAVSPLIAALEDDDLSVASSCATILFEIDRERARQAIVEAFSRKVDASMELAGSEFFGIVMELNEPSLEPALLKIRPNLARAIQVVKREFPGVSITGLPLRFEVDPSLQAEPFRLIYELNGKRNELKVVFRPNKNGEWVPAPPLPDTLSVVD